MSLTRVGKHVVRHGDLTVGINELEAVIPPQSIDWVYTDPPWGNLKFWDTMARKMGGGASHGEFDDGRFMDHLLGFVNRVTKPTAVIWVEYGFKWADLFRTHANAHGWVICGTANPQYGSAGRGLVHFVLARDPKLVTLPPDWAAQVNQTKGLKTLIAATAFAGMQPGQTILDPCCGLGFTARLAVKNQMTFYGNELNGARLKTTIEYLDADPNK